MTARLPWTAGPVHLSIRSAVPNDCDKVARFLASMDREGLYQRHFGHGEAPNQALLRRLEEIDHRLRVAVLAVDRRGEVVGHAEYVAEKGAAEFALMVLPRFRARGIGKRMLKALLDVATAAGLERMHGMIQASNGGALKVARDCDFQVIPGDDRGGRDSLAPATHERSRFARGFRRWRRLSAFASS